MSLHPASVAELQALLSAQYPVSGEQAGLLGAIRRRENGGRSVIQPGGPDARLVSISAGSDPNPWVVTICLYRKNLTPVPIYTPDFTSPTNALPRARIAWGAGKTAQTVLVDFQHGARLTLDAASLTIDAIYGLLNPDQAPNGPTIEFSASVVYGSLGSKLTTFTTEIIPLNLPGGKMAGGPVAIPEFATEMKIGSNGVSSVFDTAFGGSINAGFPAVGTPRMFPLTSRISATPNTWLEIPNGSEFVDLERTAGTGSAVTLQFKLNL